MLADGCPTKRQQSTLEVVLTTNWEGSCKAKVIPKSFRYFATTVVKGPPGTWTTLYRWQICSQIPSFSQKMSSSSAARMHFSS